jgi:type IV secretory pathway TraG/TraD family ATPase VirD4
VQNVTDVPLDPDGSLERRHHWQRTSHSLLLGTILHVLYAEKVRPSLESRRCQTRGYIVSAPQGAVVRRRLVDEFPRGTR